MRVRWVLATAGTVVLIAGCAGGSDDGQGNDRIEVLVRGLADPWGIAFLPNGDLIAVTYEDHLVHRVRDPGLPTQSEEAYTGKVLTPTAIGVSADGNFVPPCDAPNVTDLVDGFDIAGPNVDSNGPSDARIEGPSGCVASGTDGDPFYLVDSVLGRVVELQFNTLADPGDNAVRTISAATITRLPGAPTHLAFLGGLVYVADTGSDRLLEIDPATAATRTVADAADGLDHPSGLAVAPGGTLLVGNFGDGRIIEVDPSSDSVVAIHETGVGRNRLRGIAIDASGEIHLVHGDFGRRNGAISRLR